MGDLVIPAALRFARCTFRYIAQQGVTRGVYTGAAQTTGFGGDRVGASIDFTPHGGRTATGKAERSQLLAILMALRGMQNRVLLTDSSYTQRGSFPGTELFANADFSNGTNSWTIGASGALTVADGVARLTATRGAVAPEFYQQVSLTARIPYALRSLVIDGRQSSGLSAGQYMGLGDGADISNAATTRGYRVLAGVQPNTVADANYPLFVSTASGYEAGMYMSVLFTSLSRCMLTDSGGNLLLRSDEFSDATWSKVNCTVNANSATAPDGTATGDDIIEAGATNVEHYVSQAVTVPAAQDSFFVGCALLQNTRTWAVIRLLEGTGSTFADVFFNLATGAVGTTNLGANWAHATPVIESLGANWWYCGFVVRKTNAATALTVRVYSATADNSYTYAGSAATSAIRMWRGTLFQSGVPMRLVQSTSAAVAATTQTGNALYVKGLPVSTSDQLMRGDWFEVDGQIKMALASVNTAAAGLAYIELSPSLRRAVANNTPVITDRPMGRFLISGENPSWDNVPGVISTASLDLEEAFS